MSTKELQVKNSFLYLISMALQSMLPMITLPIFTRILTKEDYGILALAMAYAVFLSGLTNFGMIISYERNYFQYRNDRIKTAQLLYSAIGFVLVNFIVFAFLTYLFRVKLSELIVRSPDYGHILFWAFCSQVFYRLIHYYLTYFKNAESAKSYSFYMVLYGIINVIFSIYLVALLKVGVVGIVHAQLIAALIIFCMLSYKFHRMFPVAFDKHILMDSLKLSYPLTPRIFLGVINTQFDKYMIGLLASVGGVGIYSVGQRFSELIFTFMTSIENVFSPQVYKRMFDFENRDEGGASIGRYLTPFLYISTAIALLIAMFSEEVMSILTPPSYHEAINAIIIFSVYYGIMFFGKQPQLIYAKKTAITSLLTILNIGLNVLLNIPFIMKWGAFGAAWAILITGVISNVISFMISQHYYRIKWEYRKVAVILALFIGSSMILLLLRYLMVDYSFRLLFKSMAVVCFIWIGTKIKVVSLENFAVMKRSLLFSKV